MGVSEYFQGEARKRTATKGGKVETMCSFKWLKEKKKGKGIKSCR